MKRFTTDTFKGPLDETAESSCHEETAFGCHEETAVIMEIGEVNLQRGENSGRHDELGVVQNSDLVHPASSSKETCATEASKVVEHVESVLSGLEVNPCVDSHNSDMASTKAREYPGEHAPVPTPAPTLWQAPASASPAPEHAYIQSNGPNARWTEKEHGIVQALVQGGWTRKDIVTELTTGCVRLDRSEVKIGCRITMIGKEILTPAQYQGQLGTANKRARASPSTVVNIDSVRPLQHSAQQFFAPQPQQQQHQQQQCLPTAVPLAVYMLSQPQYQQQYTLPTQQYGFRVNPIVQQSQYYALPQQQQYQQQHIVLPQQQQYQQQHPQQLQNYAPPQQQQHQQQHLQQLHNYSNPRQHPQQFWQQRAAAVSAAVACTNASSSARSSVAELSQGGTAPTKEGVAQGRSKQI